jgi:3-methyladenine DNA glycosylase AlkD
MTPRRLARHARGELRQAADARAAARQRSYFKEWEKVLLLGVMTPEIRNIERRLYRLIRKQWCYAQALEFCELLIHDRYTEAKSLGLTLLARYHRRFEPDLLGYAKRWLEGDLCDNWAVTDQLSTGIVSRLIAQFATLAAAVESWHRSPNLWVRRASAVSFVKLAGKGQHIGRVYRIATALHSDDSDLIHKATGWLLREAGKADRSRLERYLHKYGPAIPRTTLRYAIERFPEPRRKAILAETRGAL